MQINSTEVSIKNKENENIKIRQVTESIRFYFDNPSNKPAPIATQETYNKDQTKNQTKNSEDNSLSFKIKLIEAIIKEIYDKEFDKIHSDLIKKPSNETNQDNLNLFNEPQFRIKYDKREILNDNITKNISTNGNINTNDGQKIKFNLDMQLEFSGKYKNLQNLDLNLKDEFNIDFNGSADLLNLNKFEFELANFDIVSKYPFINSGKGILSFDNKLENTSSKENLSNKKNINEDILKLMSMEVENLTYNKNIPNVDLVVSAHNINYAKQTYQNSNSELPKNSIDLSL